MIYICEYDGTADARILRKYPALLPPYDRGQAADVPSDANSGSWERIRQRVLAWLLLEYAVGRECGEHCGKPFELLGRLEVRRDIHGKPYSSAYPALYFNISHCSTACACIVSDTASGIDIERKFSYKKKLETYICHEEELPVMASLPEECRQEQLRLLWSMKESFVKMDGRGLGYGMRRVNLARLLPVKLSSEAGECGLCEADADSSFGWSGYDMNRRGAQAVTEEDGGSGRSVCDVGRLGVLTVTEADCGCGWSMSDMGFRDVQAVSEADSGSGWGISELSQQGKRVAAGADGDSLWSMPDTVQRGRQAVADADSGSGWDISAMERRSGRYAVDVGGYDNLRFLVKSTGSYTFAACGRVLPGQVFYVAEKELLT